MTKHQLTFLEGKRIWVARHSGATGAAIIRRLWGEPCNLVLTASSQLDLLDVEAVGACLRKHRPEAVVLADGRPPPGGGPMTAELLQRELRILANVLASAHDAGVERLVHIVPGYPQPPRIEALLGSLEIHGRSRLPGAQSCASRAIELTGEYARGAGRGYVALAPASVYAPGYDEHGAPPPHLLSALVASFGSAVLHGVQRLSVASDFRFLPPMMHADDVADAIVFAANLDRPDYYLRCGPSRGVPVDDLVQIVAEAINFPGRVGVRHMHRRSVHDERPTGRAIESYGWAARIPLREGIVQLYHDWLDRQIAAAGAGRFRQ